MSAGGDGGPAFPSIAPEFTGISSDGDERWENGPQGGMSLRDYFAGQALAGMLADSESGGTARDFAKAAYAQADAMLAARSSESGRREGP